MMSFQDMQQFIRIVSDDPGADFEGRVEPEEVESAQHVLGVVFPPTYRLFVEGLGAGDVNGQEFYGVIPGKRIVSAQTAPSVGLTLRERRDAGLPETAVLVGDTGMGEYYILDTSTTSLNSENPVDIWSAISGEVVQKGFASDFGSFALSFVV